jgi:hypothetical protein
MSKSRTGIRTRKKGRSSKQSVRRNRYSKKSKSKRNRYSKKSLVRRVLLSKKRKQRGGAFSLESPVVNWRAGMPAEITMDDGSRENVTITGAARPLRHWDKLGKNSARVQNMKVGTEIIDIKFDDSGIDTWWPVADLRLNWHAGMAAVALKDGKQEEVTILGPAVNPGRWEGIHMSVEFDNDDSVRDWPVAQLRAVPDAPDEPAPASSTAIPEHVLRSRQRRLKSLNSSLPQEEVPVTATTQPRREPRREPPIAPPVFLKDGQQAEVIMPDDEIEKVTLVGKKRETRLQQDAMTKGREHIIDVRYENPSIKEPTYWNVADLYAPGTAQKAKGKRPGAAKLRLVPSYARPPPAVASHTGTPATAAAALHGLQAADGRYRNCAARLKKKEDEMAECYKGWRASVESLDAAKTELALEKEAHAATKANRGRVASRAPASRAPASRAPATRASAIPPVSAAPPSGPGFTVPAEPGSFSEGRVASRAPALPSPVSAAPPSGPRFTVPAPLGSFSEGRVASRAPALPSPVTEPFYRGSGFTVPPQEEKAGLAKIKDKWRFRPA